MRSHKFDARWHHVRWQHVGAQPSQGLSRDAASLDVAIGIELVRAAMLVLATLGALLDARPHAAPLSQNAHRDEHALGERAHRRRNKLTHQSCARVGIRTGVCI